MFTENPVPERAVVLHPATSVDAPLDELDSNVELAAICSALNEMDIDVEEVSVNLDLHSVYARLAQEKPPAVFNLVDTLAGSSQMISMVPLMLEQLQLPYTGCSSMAMAQTTDKLTCKRMLAAAGLPTAPWIELTPGGEALARLKDYPYIVKPVLEHASVGILADSVVHDEVALRRIANERRRRFGGRWFAERYIDGRELSVSLLQRDDSAVVLGISEMHFLSFPKDMPRILDYSAKWDSTSFGYNNTASSFSFSPEDDELLVMLKRIALECWRVFRLASYARVDFRVDEDGNPFVLEVNCNPCLSPGAGFVLAAENAGISYAQMVGHIVASAGSLAV